MLKELGVPIVPTEEEKEKKPVGIIDFSGVVKPIGEPVAPTTLKKDGAIESKEATLPLQVTVPSGEKRGIIDFGTVKPVTAPSGEKRGIIDFGTVKPVTAPSSEKKGIIDFGDIKPVAGVQPMAPVRPVQELAPEAPNVYQSPDEIARQSDLNKLRKHASNYGIDQSTVNKWMKSTGAPSEEEAIKDILRTQVRKLPSKGMPQTKYTPEEERQDGMLTSKQADQTFIDKGIYEQTPTVKATAALSSGVYKGVGDVTRGAGWVAGKLGGKQIEEASIKANKAMQAWGKEIGTSTTGGQIKDENAIYKAIDFVGQASPTLLEALLLGKTTGLATNKALAALLTKVGVSADGTVAVTTAATNMGRAFEKLGQYTVWKLGQGGAEVFVKRAVYATQIAANRASETKQLAITNGLTPEKASNAADNNFIATFALTAAFSNVGAVGNIGADLPGIGGILTRVGTKAAAMGLALAPLEVIAQRAAIESAGGGKDAFMDAFKKGVTQDYFEITKQVGPPAALAGGLFALFDQTPIGRNTKGKTKPSDGYKYYDGKNEAFVPNAPQLPSGGDGGGAGIIPFTPNIQSTTGGVADQVAPQVPSAVTQATPATTETQVGEPKVYVPVVANDTVYDKNGKAYTVAKVSEKRVTLADEDGKQKYTTHQALKDETKYTKEIESAKEVEIVPETAVAPSVTPNVEPVSDVEQAPQVATQEAEVKPEVALDVKSDVETPDEPQVEQQAVAPSGEVYTGEELDHTSYTPNKHPYTARLNENGITVETNQGDVNFSLSEIEEARNSNEDPSVGVRELIKNRYGEKVKTWLDEMKPKATQEIARSGFAIDKATGKYSVVVEDIIDTQVDAVNKVFDKKPKSAIAPKQEVRTDVVAPVEPEVASDVVEKKQEVVVKETPKEKVKETPKDIVKKEVVVEKTKKDVAVKEVQKDDIIEDFGEKIGGARKDAFYSYRSKMREVVPDVEVAKLPLSKTFPHPNYKALLEAGVSPQNIALIRAMRDTVPAKPRRGADRWAKRVKTLKTLVADLLKDEVKAEDFRNKLADNPLLENYVNAASLYEAVGHDVSLKNYRLGESTYSYLDGKRYDTPQKRWEVNEHVSAGLSSRSSILRTVAYGDTREEAIKNFKKAFSSKDAKAPKKAKSQLMIYKYSNKPDAVVWIGRKVGSGATNLKSFKSIAEARDYLNKNEQALEEQFQKMKDIPSERREKNEPRVGKDLRKGKGVTPKLFTETFGFRGVEFGNWVEQGIRQADLNRAFDALIDLATIIDIEPLALSLNGELGLAFGARGRGGKHSFAAHYEPSAIVINLTKKRGAGSLAHEWMHAVDNYFSRKSGKKEDFISESGAVYSSSAGLKHPPVENVRAEMVEAFGKITKAIYKSGLLARSRELDKTRAKPYWHTNLEMLARSFESYLIEKLDDQGIANDYLANIISEDAWNSKIEPVDQDKKTETYPYPKESELPDVKKAFDNFFDVVETRKTDKGVEMYSLQKVFDGEDLPIVTLKQISASVPGAKVSETKNGLVKIQFKNGFVLYVDTSAGGIIIDPAIVKRDYGRDVEADDIVRASSKVISGDGFIKLVAGMSGVGEFDHELMHIAEEIALNNKQRSILKKEVGDKEARANTYADFNADRTENMSTLIRSIFQKIKDFFSKIRARLFGEKSEDIFRKVADGSIWKQQMRNTKVTAISPSGKQFHLMGIPSPQSYKIVHHGTAFQGIKKFVNSPKHHRTGEGYTFFGVGVYFTERENIAKSYRKQNVDKLGLKKPEDTYLGKTLLQLSNEVDAKALVAATPKEAAKYLDMDLLVKAVWKGAPAKSVALAAETKGYYLKHSDGVEAIKWFKENMADPGVDAKPGPGAVYTVEIPDDKGQYLLWDKPLSEQSEKIQKFWQTHSDIVSREYNRDNPDVWTEFFGGFFGDGLGDNGWGHRLFEVYSQSNDGADTPLLKALELANGGKLGDNTESFASNLSDQYLKNGVSVLKAEVDKIKKVAIELNKDPAIAKDHSSALKEMDAIVASLEKIISWEEDFDIDPWDKISGKQAYDLLADKLNSDYEASVALNEAGIVGIKYYDGLSRSSADKNATFNYVMFNDDAMSILKESYSLGKNPKGDLTNKESGAILQQDVNKGGKEDGLQRGEQKKRTREERTLATEGFTAERHNRANDAKSRPYTRASADGTRGSWDVANTYEPSGNVTSALDKAGLGSMPIYELNSTPRNATNFLKQITQSKNSSRYGAAVSLHSADAYQNEMKLFITENGKSGFAIHPETGEIRSVFAEKGTAVVHWMLTVAEGEGGTWLECYDTILRELYEANGFVITERADWNPEYAPEDWDELAFALYKGGRPDYLTMKLKNAKLYDSYGAEDGAKGNATNSLTDKRTQAEKDADPKTPARERSDDLQIKQVAYTTINNAADIVTGVWTSLRGKGASEKELDALKARQKKRGNVTEEMLAIGEKRKLKKNFIDTLQEIRESLDKTFFDDKAGISNLFGDSTYDYARLMDDTVRGRVDILFKEGVRAHVKDPDGVTLGIEMILEKMSPQVQKALFEVALMENTVDILKISEKANADLRQLDIEIDRVDSRYEDLLNSTAKKHGGAEAYNKKLNALATEKDKLNKAIAKARSRVRTGLLERHQYEAGIKDYYATFKELREAQKELAKFNRYVLRQARDGGVISNALYDSLITERPNYVPSQRDFSGEVDGKKVVGLNTPGGYVDQGSVLMKLGGSEKNWVHPLPAMIRNTYRVYSMVAKQNIARAMISAAMSDPSGDPLVWRTSQYKPVVEGEHQFYIWEEGKKAYYATHDKTILDVLMESQSSIGDLGVVDTVLDKTANFLRQMVTLSPTFAIHNFQRDTFRAGVYGENFWPIISSAQGLAELFRHNGAGRMTDAIYDYNFAGGAFTLSAGGKASSERLAKRLHGKKTLNPSKAMHYYLSAFTELSEQSTRTGQYLAAIKLEKNLTTEESATIARELCNFAKAGTFIRRLSRGVPFISPAIQDMNKFYKEHKNPKTRYKTMAKGFAKLTIPTLILFAWNNSDDERRKHWLELEQYKKDLYWYFIIDGDHAIRWRKPFMLGTVYATGPEIIMDAIWNKKQMEAATFLKTFVGSSLPSVIPTALNSLIAIGTGYDMFRGRKILNGYEEKLDAKEQYDVKTNELIKRVARTCGLSPKRLEHFVASHSGMIGQDTLRMVDAVYGAYGVPKKPAKFWYEFFPMSVAIVEPVRNFMGPLDNWYKVSRKLEGAVATVEKIAGEPGGIERMTPEQRKILSEIKIIKGILKFNTGKGDIRDLQKEKRELLADVVMTAKQKRVELDRINKSINEKATLALVMANDYMPGVYTTIDVMEERRKKNAKKRNSY